MTVPWKSGRLVTGADIVVGVGDPLLVIGYPRGFSDELNNLPIFRQASVASVYPVPFGDRTEYRYGPDGAKTSIQMFDPKTIEQPRHAAFAGSAWDAADAGYGVPTGGTVTINYHNGILRRRCLPPDSSTLKTSLRSKLWRSETNTEQALIVFWDRMGQELVSG